MFATLYPTTDRDATPARSPRQLAYHLDEGVHGHVEPSWIPGYYRWYPTPGHDGILVDAAALVLAPVTLDQIIS
jgi:hypothetical protein